MIFNKCKIEIMVKIKSIPLFFVMFLFLVPREVSAKDYSIPQSNIKVQINSDGSADITETRTYRFDGSYTWADEWIPLTAKCAGCNNYVIQNFSLHDETEKYIEVSSGQQNTYQISTTSDKFYVKWYYRAANTTKTFTLNYKVVNAITNQDRKSTRLNSSHGYISYAVFCL